MNYLWAVPRLLVNAFLAFLLICSCGRKEQDHGSRSVFRYNESSGISSLDPAFASNQANIWACSQLFNGLVQLDDSLLPRPCIARSWAISSDGKTYTFHLRTGVRFHAHPAIKPGRTVRAADFLYSFERICAEATASPGAWVFQPVQRDSSGKVIGFSAPDDSTLIIQLSTPFPPMLGLLASPYCSVVPREVIDAIGKDFRKHPVGTGPFVFRFWEERNALVMHKNTGYFERDGLGNPLPYLDAIQISFISDKQSAFFEFLKGKLDFFSGLDASYKDDLLTGRGELRPKYRGKFKLETSPYLNTEYLGILIDSGSPLMKGSPLRNLKIRQAINLGFDKGKMVRFLRNGMAIPGTSGFVPPGMPGFTQQPVRGYGYDPQHAKRLLAEAGYPDGKGLPEITLSTTSSYLDLCEYMQGELSNLGIRLRIDVNQASQHRQMVARQQLAFFRASWIADYADPENYLALFRSQNKAPAGPNTTHFSNRRFDQLYDQALATSDQQARNRLYVSMDSLMMLESPVIVLYYDKVLRLSQNSVTGLRINPMNMLNLKQVRISSQN